MVILGGLGTIKGVFIGGAFILLFPILVNSISNNFFHGIVDATIISAIEQVMLGALIVLFMIYEPLGVAKLWDNFTNRWGSVYAESRRTSQPLRCELASELMVNRAKYDVPINAIIQCSA